MTAGLPPKYTDVANTLARRGAVNVMGVVVDVWGGAFKSNGTSLCITFTIKDSNLDNGHTWDGLKIRYFKDTESLLPPVREGDVILLRDLWVKILEGRPLGVAAQIKTVPWAIFRPDRDPTSHLSALSGPVPFEPTYAEKSYAQALLEASPTTFRTASTSLQSLPPAAASKPASTTRRKFSLLKDVEELQFVDLIGEIVKIYCHDSEKVTLYLTDYTANELLFNYASDDVDHSRGREGDEYNYIPRQRNWNGPSGQMTIQITLWQPHASFVQEKFNENDLVRLKDVRIKRSRVDQSLEGVMHGDRAHPDAVNAFHVDTKNDPRVQELLARQTEYWEAHPRKRKAEEEPKKSSKKSKSNTKKQRAKAPPKKEQGQTSLDVTSLERNKRSAVNPHVKAAIPDGVPSVSLERIKNCPTHTNNSPDGIEYRLPFQNLCYHSTVRVIDFFPPRLEDFAVPQEHRSIAYSRTRDENARTYIIWEWRFCLLVESFPSPASGQPKELLKLFVSNPDAQHLLKEDAVNLRENPAKLAILREKLFILWGDLEERKRKAIEDGKNPLDLGAVSSVPFTCCIKEYGIRCSHSRSEDGPSGCSDQDCFGWERRFGLFQTGIHG